MEQQKNTALVPIVGAGEHLHAVFSPVTGDKPVRNPEILRHICALFCALSCLICITVVFLLALSAAAGTDFRIRALRIAEQAFLGRGMIELTDDIPKADGSSFPYPAPDTASPPGQRKHTVGKRTAPNRYPWHSRRISHCTGRSELRYGSHRHVQRNLLHAGHAGIV